MIAFDTSDYTLPALSFVLAHRPTQEIARFTANIWGKHNAMPLALAASVGHELGISLQDCADSLEKFQALPGRGRVILIEDNTKFIVDDSYNANPASMRASLETFARVKAPGKIAVLGEMRELGPDAATYHENLTLLLENIEHVILVGSLWPEHKGFIRVGKWQEALEHLRTIMSNNDWSGVLVKGSNSIGLSNVVKEITE